MPEEHVITAPPPDVVYRRTPSHLTQMSRDWLDDPMNPAMTEWRLKAGDLYAGVMVVDLATPAFRVALSGDFETYLPVLDLEQLASVRVLGEIEEG